MGTLIEFGGGVVGEGDEGKKHRSADRRWNSAIPRNRWMGSGNEHVMTYASAQTLFHRRL
jgi:hypothetical protein